MTYVIKSGHVFPDLVGATQFCRLEKRRTPRARSRQAPPFPKCRDTRPAGSAHGPPIGYPGLAPAVRFANGPAICEGLLLLLSSVAATVVHLACRESAILPTQRTPRLHPYIWYRFLPRFLVGFSLSGLPPVQMTTYKIPLKQCIALPFPFFKNLSERRNLHFVFNTPPPTADPCDFL